MPSIMPNPAAAAVMTRATHIANAIRAAISPLLDTDAARILAKDSLTTATETDATSRESVLGLLAAAATADNWTTIEVKIAADMATKMAGLGNDSMPKTIATFIGEAKRVMHPNARAYFAHNLRLCNEAWTAETDAMAVAKAAKEPAVTPLRKAFARKYHMILAVIGEGARDKSEECNYFHEVQDLVAFADDRDPELSAEKMFAKVEQGRKVLATISARFPDVDLTGAIDMLNKVTQATMQAAYNEQCGIEAPAPDAKPDNTAQSGSAPPRKKASVARVSATVVDGTVGEGAIDLDDIMSDFSGATTTVADLAHAA